MRLYCDNIDAFIDGINHHYSVTSNRYEQGKVVTLFDDYKECNFRIENVIYFKEHTVLSLEKIEGSEHEREVISNHYAGYNLND